MKNLFLLLIVVLISVVTVFPQSCLPDGITFSTQEEIDGFQNLYPNCTKIEGDVIISGNDIKNLNGLSVLTSVQNKLNIEYNDSLISLSGLNNVTNIGSNLIIEFNNSLNNISDLGSLTRIGGDFEIRRNEKLTDLSGLNSLESIEKTFSVYKNENLKNFEGLEALESIGEYLYVYFNPSLINLSGINNISTTGGLIVYNNKRLKTLAGLELLETINDDIYIYFNDSLIEIADLMNVSSINGELWIHDNPLLLSLKGIDNIDANTIEQVLIHNNYSLSECEVKSICDFIAMGETSDGPLNNAEGCNTTNQIKAACEALSIYNAQTSEIINIYPNPANQAFIEVRTTNVIESIRIFNQYGQNIVNQLGPYNRINISSLKQGFYVIKVEIDSKAYSKKIIVE